MTLVPPLARSHAMTSALGALRHGVRGSAEFVAAELRGFGRGWGAGTWAAALVAASTFCCAEEPEPPLELRVQVTSDGVTPVAGAQMRARGEYLGSTDGTGNASLQLPGHGDAPPGILVTCPDGFVTPLGEKVPVAAPGNPAAGRTFQLELLCPPELRDAVVLVHAAGDAVTLPVKVDGVVVGQTDSLGFAHVHVRAAPDSEFEVSIDTSANERLSPASPSRRYRLRRSDELFLLDANFEQPKAEARKRRGNAKRRPPVPPGAP